jgi:hypothetical protein
LNVWSNCVCVFQAKLVVLKKDQKTRVSVWPAGGALADGVEATLAALLVAVTTALALTLDAVATDAAAMEAVLPVAGDVALDAATPDEAADDVFVAVAVVPLPQAVSTEAVNSTLLLAATWRNERRLWRVWAMVTSLLPKGCPHRKDRSIGTREATMVAQSVNAAGTLRGAA